MKRHRDGQRGKCQGSPEVPSSGALPTPCPLPFANGAVSNAHPTSDSLAGFLARGSSRGWLLGLLLVFATVLAYQPAWRSAFLWDDDFFLVQNRTLSEPGGMQRIWFSPDSTLYYPLVFTSYRLERSLWGLNPAGYHWVNLLLHAFSAVWFWRVLRRLQVPGAWLAGAVFALHPVNVESVAWISERKNTLAMFFYLLSLLLYLRFDEPAKVQGPKSKVQSPRSEVRNQDRASGDTHRAPRTTPEVPAPSSSPLPSPSWRFYWLSLFAFVLALLSKTAVSPFPVVLLGLAWWQRGRVTSRDVWRSAPFFTASLVLGLVTIWFERTYQIGTQIVRDDSFWSRLAGAGWAVCFYFYKAVLPLNLMTIYPRWQVDAAKVWSYVPGLLVVGAFLLGWQYRRSWGNAWLLCLGYYVVMLLPVLGFLSIGFMFYSLVADRWQYFALLGPIALASAVFASKFKAHRSRLDSSGSSRALSPFGLLLGTMLLLALGALTWRQSALYANAEALWQGALAANPDCWPAHYNLGLARVRQGRVNEAIAHFQTALQIRSDLPAAHHNLGSCYLQQGKVDEAIAQYQMALQIDPEYAEAQSNLGAALAQKGGVDEAIAHYRRALQLRPDYAEAHNNLGLALLQKGGVDEAIAQYQMALQLKPDYAEAHNNLGTALVQKGRMAEAITQYQKALQLEPADPKTQNNLALLLATGAEVSLRNGDQAVQLARQANDLAGGKNPLYLRTLAAAYAEAGQFSDAMRAAQEAIQLAQAAGQSDLVARLNDELKRYQAGHPLHQ